MPLEIKFALLTGTLMIGMAVVLAITGQNLVIAGVVVVLGTGLEIFVVHRVTMPLGALRQAFSAIARGNLDVRIEPRTEDQVGQLVGAFGEMSQAIQERERIWGERFNALEQRNADLENALFEWQSKSEAQGELLEVARELSSPAVPVFQGIVVLPLIGQISRDRAELITSNLLTGIQEYDARVAIIDITGVPEIDEQSALVLLRAAQAAELMGCRPVLTGLRPEFAQALIRLDVDTGRLVTRSDLEGGMVYGLASLGFSVSKRNGRRGGRSAAVRQKGLEA